MTAVPDKDLKSGAYPPGLIAPSVVRDLGVGPALGADQVAPPSGQPSGESFGPRVLQSNLELEPDRKLTAPANQVTVQAEPASPANGPEPTSEQLNSVVWSAWSQWSSCVDKNGLCDPQRLHSRLRKCVAQLTGEKVEAIQCRQRFNMQDQELEVADCSASCAQQPAASSFPEAPMSDAPSFMGPNTAPTVVVWPSEAQPAFVLPSALGSPHPARPSSVGGPAPLMKSKGEASSSSALAVSMSPRLEELSSAPQQPPVVLSSPLGPTTDRSQLLDALSTPTSSGAGSGGGSGGSSSIPLLEQQQQMSCSNCTSDEICLLLITQKVPFCAKIKERSDESGCGGWCKAESQLCQPMGPKAFKCIHDSECLADEWRCNDSACIPLSKRCDGHSNCYDNSDERDCLAS